MSKPYSLSAVDQHGNFICGEGPIGEPRNRIFDPTSDTRYAARLPLPAEITMYNQELGLTHLRLVDTYTARPSDKFVTTESGLRYQRDTMVIEVGAVVRDGITVAARNFGKESKYNQPGGPKPGEPPAKAIGAIIDIGCQKIEGIVSNHRFLKRVIFMLSEKAIYEGVQNVWEWLRNGFPPTLDSGLEVMDFKFLHINLTHLEAKGVEVLFWLVQPEYLIGPYLTAEDFMDHMAGLPVNKGNPCNCENCIAGEQHRELSFARTGKELCPCEPCRQLIQKYGGLKKGETFPFTNNAHLDVQVTMEVDGERVASTKGRLNKT